MLALKDLADHIDVSIVSPIMLDQGWTYDTDQGSTGDTHAGRTLHYQLYTAAQADYTGRSTVPVLWDKKLETIVSNESIDAWNERIYPAINNGVYRAGFATTQAAYEEAYREVFAELDHLDQHLAHNRYLLGDQLTEADIRLFTTLIRFDAVYHGHFKLNRQRLEDFQHLPGYIRDIYQLPGVANTVNFEHIKTHYYASHLTINPTGVVPLGPDIDYGSAHHREIARH
jgi:putative glutathione S-transferase